MKSKKTKIIIVMGIALFFMAVGYALLSTNLNIRGTSNITDTWGVRIEKVTNTATGRAYNIDEPTYTNTTMTFNVGLKEPGDAMEFAIDIKNYGTLDALLENVDAKAVGSNYIVYTISGIQEGGRLLAGQTQTMIVKVEFDIDATKLPNEPVKEITIDLDYVQDDGQTTTPTNPSVDSGREMLLFQKLWNRGGINDTLMNSCKAQAGYIGGCDDNTVFINKRETSNDPTAPEVYYFQGDTTNNYVKFAGYYWRIVSFSKQNAWIKLVYQGTTPTATGASSVVKSSPGYNYYNYATHNAYVGYMYGLLIDGYGTYSTVHRNDNNSNIKSLLDAWYRNRLLKYDEFMYRGSFCSERGIQNALSGYGVENTTYDSNRRLSAPTYKCNYGEIGFNNPDEKGLTYPIGTLTLDEILYASGVTPLSIADDEEGLSPSLTGYLNIDYPFWTMTPSHFVKTGSGTGVAYIWAVAPDQNIGGTGYAPNNTNRITRLRADYGYGQSNVDIGVRPVIMLSGVGLWTTAASDGTADNPYVILID